MKSSFLFLLTSLLLFMACEDKAIRTKSPENDSSSSEEVISSSSHFSSSSQPNFESSSSESPTEKLSSSDNEIEYSSSFEAYSSSEMIQPHIRLYTYGYMWSGFPILTLNIVNQENYSLDSLELEIFLNAGPGQLTDFRLRADMCFPYDVEGFILESCVNPVNSELLTTRAIEIPDSWSPETSTFGYSINIPIPLTTLPAGSRLRLDLAMQKASPYGDDLLNEPPTHIPGSNDWSFKAHTTTMGSPVDYIGLEFNGTNRTAADDLFSQNQNPYIAVYYRGDLISGYRP